MTTGFMCYIHEGDVIRGVICSLYMDTAWYSDLASRSISLEYDIITQPAMRYLAFAISSDNVSWEVLHVQDTQNVTGMASVTIPDTYDGTVKLGLKLYDAPPTVGSILNVGFDYVTTGGISVSTTQNGKTVTMTCATQGAVIRYTVDGSDPTEQSTEYAGEFVIDHDCTVKAKAWKDGLEPSDIVSKTVEIPVPVPVVILGNTTVGFFRYATLDFTNIFEQCAILQAYEQESFIASLKRITVESGETGRLRASGVGGTFSGIFVYVLNDDKNKRTMGFSFPDSLVIGENEGVLMSSIQLNAPTITNDNGLITITNTFSGEVEHTYYSIDYGEYQEYTGPFQMEASGTVRAYCTGTGYENSAVKSIEVTVEASGNVVGYGEDTVGYDGDEIGYEE